MELTAEIVESYVGGQMEIQNPGKGYLKRGDIAAIQIEDDGDDAALRVTFTWLGKGEGFPPLPSRWVKDDDLEYLAVLKVYDVSEIGDGRIALNSSRLGELTVLYPPGGSKLDPSKVEGLHLTSG